MGRRSRYLAAVLFAAVLAVPAFANLGRMNGTISLVTNHPNGLFSVGPLEKTNSATITATTAAPIQFDIFQDLPGYADDLDIFWNGATGSKQNGQSIDFFAFPAGLGADLTSGTFCITGGFVTSLVSQPFSARTHLSSIVADSCFDTYGTMTVTYQIKYDVFGVPFLSKLTGTMVERCESQILLTSTQQDTLTTTFSLTDAGSELGLLTKPPGVTNAPDVPKPQCFNSTAGSGGGGGTGGGTGGGDGGGGTGGTGGGNPIGAFPGFGGFGAGAFPGTPGTGGGGSSSGTPFVAVDTAFDQTDGVPSLENTDELDLPLAVVSGGNTDNVHLTASSDPDGLDLSFVPDTLPPNNDLALPILIVRPRADTLARDYLITVTASSGSTQGTTSFLISLTCDPPFISSLSSSQPQAQTISSGQPATLSVTAIGTGPFRYQWYEGTTGNTDFPVSGATDRILTTPALTSSHTYWVRVTNPCGTSDSNPATVTVN